MRANLTTYDGRGQTAGHAKDAQGLEISVPKRRDLMDAFRKIVGAPVKKKP